MTELISLNCINCGGSLEVTSDRDMFFCSYCGHRHALKRSGSSITVTEGLDKIQTNTDRTASELAIVRLTDEIRKLDAEIGNNALLNKAIRMEMTDVTKSMIKVTPRRYKQIVSASYSIEYAAANAHLIDINALVADYETRLDNGIFNLNRNSKVKALAILNELKAKIDKRENIKRELEMHKNLVKI